MKMENKEIYRPSKPNEPNLLKLHETNLFKLLYRSKYFIIGSVLYYYWMYIENSFESLYIYYAVIGFYTLRRFWPALMQNGDIRAKNKKMIDSYQKEVISYNKKLETYLKYEKDRFRLIGKSDFLEISDYDAAKTTEYFKRKEERRQKSVNISKTSLTGSFLDNKTLVSNIVDNELESEITNTIRNYSGICAVLAIQPIPFADIFILTPTQILMGKKIASLRGYEITENSIESILKEISGVIGLGIIAQQLLIGAYKTVLPFLGGITTIPAVYGLTYGIGKVMDYYIVAKINGNKINKSEIEKIFKFSRKIGESEGKTKEKEIYARSKQ